MDKEKRSVAPRAEEELDFNSSAPEVCPPLSGSCGFEPVKTLRALTLERKQDGEHITPEGIARLGHRRKARSLGIEDTATRLHFNQTLKVSLIYEQKSHR